MLKCIQIIFQLPKGFNKNNLHSMIVTSNLISGDNRHIPYCTIKVPSNYSNLSYYPISAYDNKLPETIYFKLV